MSTKSGDQMVTKALQGRRFARSDIRYWQKLVFQRVRRRRGKEDKSKHFSVRLQFAGRREEFNLRTANRAAAVGRAREIYDYLKVNGCAARFTKFKLRPAPKATGSVETVGDLIEAIQALAGETITVATLLPPQIRAISRRDIAHVRELQTA